MLVHASINYTAPMNERPKFHANDKSLDRVTLDPRTVSIKDGRSAPDQPNLAHEGLELFECGPERRSLSALRR